MLLVPLDCFECMFKQLIYAIHLYVFVNFQNVREPGFLLFNPFKPKGIPHYYHLDRSISVLTVFG